MPTCAAPTFPERWVEDLGLGDSREQEGPCLSRSTLSVEHHYHNLQALEKLIDEGTSVFAEMAVVSACQLYASHPCGSQQITMACACNHSRGKKM